jgi:hypothetical protein
MDIKVTQFNLGFSAKIKLKEADIKKIAGTAMLATGAATITGPVAGCVVNQESCDVFASAVPRGFQVYGDSTLINLKDSAKGDPLATASFVPTVMSETIGALSIYAGADIVKDGLEKDEKKIPS